jgi:bifunctional non-homologous end joining protein LigD
MFVDGFDVRPLACISRKTLLERAVAFRSPVRFLEHRDRDGEALYAQACKDGLEGLIAKRRDSSYVGRRSPDWLKFKCVNEQEMVIAGFTDPAGARVGFGALLLGYYEKQKLRYAGKVGTGFSSDVLTRLHRRLAAREVKRSPFAEVVQEKGAHWVRPDLVAEIGFTEWTRDGKLRHPRFVGLRTDKPPREVVREVPQP